MREEVSKREGNLSVGIVIDASLLYSSHEKIPCTIVHPLVIELLHLPRCIPNSDKSPHSKEKSIRLLKGNET